MNSSERNIFYYEFNNYIWLRSKVLKSEIVFAKNNSIN